MSQTSHVLITCLPIRFVGILMGIGYACLWYYMVKINGWGYHYLKPKFKLTSKSY
ncbi:hypothetical protein Hanom_Chr00s000004g01606971 [Helianthus anomalus]